jgi:predicted nucleic acid-binding protein
VARFVDTNVIIHYLSDEKDAKADRCLALLRQAEDRDADLVTTDLVLAEVVWVLQARSGVSRARIRDLLMPVLLLPGLRVPNKQSWPRVFDLFCERGIDFIDAYNAVTMERTGVTEIYSYDHDFDGFETFERMEP